MNTIYLLTVLFANTTTGNLAVDNVVITKGGYNTCAQLAATLKEGAPEQGLSLLKSTCKPLSDVDMFPSRKL